MTSYAIALGGSPDAAAESRTLTLTGSPCRLADFELLLIRLANEFVAAQDARAMTSPPQPCGCEEKAPAQ